MPAYFDNEGFQAFLMFYIVIHKKGATFIFMITLANQSINQSGFISDKKCP